MGQPVDVGQLVREGVAVMAATADAALRPQLSRAWGTTLSEDGERLTVCVHARPDSPMVDNLRMGARIAVRVTQLMTYASVQFKGTIEAVGAPTPERLDVVADHAERWVAQLRAIGSGEETARAMVGADLVSVTMTVEERLNMTPGAGSGSRL